jgi:hypothetical protein
MLQSAGSSAAQLGAACSSLLAVCMQYTAAVVCAALVTYSAFRNGEVIHENAHDSDVEKTLAVLLVLTSSRIFVSVRENLTHNYRGTNTSQVSHNDRSMLDEPERFNAAAFRWLLTY